MRVGVVQRCCHLLHYGQGFLQGQPPVETRVQQLLQRLPINQFHHQEAGPAVLLIGELFTNIRVVRLHQELGIPFHGSYCAPITSDFGGQKLQGYSEVKLGVTGLPDLAHAPLPQLLQKNIAPAEGFPIVREVRVNNLAGQAAPDRKVPQRENFGGGGASGVDRRHLLGKDAGRWFYNSYLVAAEPAELGRILDLFATLGTEHEAPDFNSNKDEPILTENFMG